ncbi:MAG: response regulator [Gemmataceae bacterium]
MSGRRWLLVDDDPEIAFIVRLLTQRRGDELLHAFDVPHAEQTLATQIDPLIILLDVHLPGISGIDWLRSRKPKQSVAMFAQSHFTEELVEALEAGANYWVTKESVTQGKWWNQRLDEIVQLDEGATRFDLADYDESCPMSTWWDTTRLALGKPVGSTLLGATFRRALNAISPVGIAQEELLAWIVQRSKGNVASVGPSIEKSIGRAFLHQISCLFGVYVAHRLIVALTSRQSMR